MSYRFEAEAGGLVCRYRGRVDDDAVFALGHRLWEAMEDRPVRHVIVDCTAVDAVTVRESDIIAYAYADRVATLRAAGFRMAAVATRRDVVDTLALFRRYLSRPGIELEIFPDEAAARAWATAPGDAPTDAAPGIGSLPQGA